MRQLLLTKKIMVVVMLALAMSLKVKAADTFIVFEPASGHRYRSHHHLSHRSPLTSHL